MGIHVIMHMYRVLLCEQIVIKKIQMMLAELTKLLEK